MKFYTTPEKVNYVKRELNKVFGKLTIEPNITFSEPTKVMTTDIYKSGIERHYINVVEVTIDDISTNEWVLVADVNHINNAIVKISDKYFSQIPEGFGLDNYTCDYCGKKHSNRLSSHIMVNKVTGEWQQVGTSCFHKMSIDGKFISQISVRLIKKMKDNFDVYDSVSAMYSRGNINIVKAYTINSYMPYVYSHFKCYPEWQYKTENLPGSAQLINTEFGNNVQPLSDEYISKIYEFVKNLNGESEFILKMKSVFECGYINNTEIHYVYYAIKMYENSIKTNDFSELIKQYNITAGEKFSICGDIIKSKYIEFDYAQDYFSTSYWEHYIKDDKTGLVFVSRSTALDKYKTDDNKYKFTGNVGFIHNNKQLIYLKGRLSK